MNITELDSFSLADAVKFHNRLNPRLWGRDEHLHPEVQRKLLEIAADFQEFLGVSDLDVVDITVSGSNAAYSYTPHSDIDLHLVVRAPEGADEVYQELFNAKKYQYNDLHDIRIKGADVELYVQPADEPPVSLGEYSVKNNKWLQVPRRQRSKIDHSSVKAKYEDVKNRIEQTLQDSDAQRMAHLIAKIKQMRQAGLAQHGEFGPENLAFKLLRTQGLIKQLYDAQAAARDQELSLAERKKSKSKPKFRWGYGGYYAPGFSFGNEAGDGGGDSGGESMREGHQGSPYSSEDGVAPSTQMFLNEDDREDTIHEFISNTAQRLGIERLPEIVLHNNDQWSEQNHSFGMYEPESHTLHVNLDDRHIMDILRTTAHELVHCRQHELASLGPDAGDTGSPIENEAHAVAGIIMRDFADAHPGLFESSGYIPTDAEKNDPRYLMALSVDVRPGATGLNANKMALKTDAQGKPGLLMKTVNLREGRMPQPSQGPGKYRDLNQPLGPETPPTMPKGTVRVDVSDVYDWYKLGQHISNMKGLGKHDFGQGAPSAILSFGDEDTEHQYIKDLKATGLTTTDIDPASHETLPGQKTDPTYNVDEDIVESLRREFALLEDEYISEVRMSTANLRQLAAKTGAQAGMEFEMIVPNVGEIDREPEYERDEGPDRRARSFDDIEQFFYDGDYNGRGDIRRLMEALNEAYMEWKMERTADEWADEGVDYFRDFVANNDLFDRDEALDQARDEVIDANPDLPTDSEEFQQLVNTRINELEEQYVLEEFERQGAAYSDAFEAFAEEKNEDYDEQEFLRETSPYMSDVETEYDIQWPYWYDANEGNDGEMDIDQVADDFSNSIGKPVNSSSSYHGARREPGHYVVEPDGSLEGDNPGDAGLEFVSPPMPIDELLSDLNKVKTWAGREGCYTNDSTGLHINISVPNYSLDKLDYVKLALLMGDEYVLDLFGRSGNHYAKAATGKIRDALKRNPDLAPALMDKMRGHMEDLATKAIHSGRTDKYTSINTKEGYIEFRSPGGDWLDENFDKVENTLLRFTVALSAAIDPEAYRKEYLKKLYKLLEGVQDKGGVDVINLFANYSAGELDKAALIRQVRQKQLARNVAKGKTTGPMWWSVTNPANNSASIEVVANNAEEAIASAILPGNYPEWARVQNTLRATPVRPYTPPKAKASEPAAPGRGNWGIWISSINRFANQPGEYARGAEVPLYRFPSREAAEQWIEQQRTARPNMRSDIEVREIPAEPAVPQGGSTGNWGVWVPALDRYATIGNSGPRRFEAEAEARAWIQDYNARHSSNELELVAREIEPSQQQPAQQSGRYTYRVFTTDSNQTVGTFQSDGIQGSTGAMFAFRNYLRSIGRDSAEGFNYEEIGRERQSSQFQEPSNNRGDLTPHGPGPWEIYRISDNSSVRELSNTSRPEAEAEARRALGLRGEAPELYGVRTRQAQQQTGRNQVGQTYTPAGSGEFTGQWLVLDPQGQVIYRFGGIGNSQSDANRLAIQWLQQNPRHMQAGVEVVPEMG